MERKKEGLKLVLIILPIVLLSMLALMGISYFAMANMSEKQIVTQMDTALSEQTETIKRIFDSNANLSVTLARTVEGLRDSLEKENYKDILTKVLLADFNTVGSGIWFEPDQFKKGITYFGPYAYKVNGKPIYTDEYSLPEYNYFKQNWYTNVKDGSKEYVWSTPYYDPIAKVTMVTSTSPLIDQDGILFGRTTADLDLSTLQNIIEDTVIGKTGSVFLIDENGLYVATENQEKIMKQKMQEEANPSLANVGALMLKDPEGRTSFIENGEKYRVYFKQVPEIKLIIGIKINESELNEPISSLLTKLIFITIICIVIVTFLSIDLILEVNRRTRDLRSSNKELVKNLDDLHRLQGQLIDQEKMAALGGVVASISHEVNTPLGIMQTTLSYFENEAKTIRSLFEEKKLTQTRLKDYFDDSNESIEILIRSVKRAIEIIQNLKSMATDQMKEEREIFDICEYMEKIKGNMKYECKKNHVDLLITCEGAKKVWSYPGYFSQVFTNLIMNSIHHGFEKQEGGQIHIQLAFIEEELVITYRDNGCGMDAENLEKMYDAFYTTRKNNGGTGLGMNIVRSLIVNKLGGEIDCTSELGHGVVFTIKIPKESWMIS